MTRGLKRLQRKIEGAWSFWRRLSIWTVAVKFLFLSFGHGFNTHMEGSLGMSCFRGYYLHFLVLGVAYAGISGYEEY